MFSAFEGPPKIVRLWGKGRVLEIGTREFQRFVDEQNVDIMPGSRSIIVVDVHQVGGSCGFSVPYFDFKDFRPILNDFFEKKQKKYKEGNERESMDQYWAFKNAWSMDGLPAMKRGLIAGKRDGVEPIKKMVGSSAPKSYERVGGFTVVHLVLTALSALLFGMLVATYGVYVVERLQVMLPDNSKMVVWPHALGDRSMRMEI